jgi:hypothetical protein
MMGPICLVDETSDNAMKWTGDDDVMASFNRNVQSRNSGAYLSGTRWTLAEMNPFATVQGLIQCLLQRIIRLPVPNPQGFLCHLHPLSFVLTPI